MGYLLSPFTACAIALAMIATAMFSRARKRGFYDHLPGPTNKTNLGYLPDLHAGTSLDDYHYPMTEKYGHVVRLKGGMFGLQDDALYITDPAALNAILVRNVNSFPESVEFSGLFGIIHHGDGFTSSTGAEHRKQRRLINPVFTAGFISELSPMFYKVAHELCDKLTKAIGDSNDGRVVDVLHYMSSTSLELIGQGGLGRSFNSFEGKSDFHEALETVLPMSSRIFFVLPYLESWRKIEPVWLRRFLASAVDYIPWPAARKLKWGVDTMHPVFADLFNSKKRILEEGGMAELEKTASGGKDIATLFIQANQAAGEKEKMSDDSVIANMSGIVLGGHDTTTSALIRLMCMVAENPDLQARLRQEILEARTSKGGEELNYRELNELALLDGVCREVLRLFSPVTFVWRQTTEDTSVPLHFPVRDPKTGVETKELLITKGTRVYVGLGAANRSKAIWGPDVHELKPERWIGKSVLDGTKDNVKMPGIFSNTMTFLAGARACAGMKFALLEIKLVLSVLLSQFSFELVPREEIEWRLDFAVVPYVKGQVSQGPKAPLRAKRI